jgi:hypothetical protein
MFLKLKCLAKIFDMIMKNPDSGNYESGLSFRNYLIFTKNSIPTSVIIYNQIFAAGLFFHQCLRPSQSQA